MAGDQIDHAHDDPAAWFRALDVIVWAAVVVIVVLGAEWLGGYMVRERLARSFGRYLERVNELRER